MGSKLPLKRILFSVLLIVALAFALQWFRFLFTLEKEFPYKGKIDDCCCEAGVIKNMNKDVAQVTESLAKTLFFKIFRVNLESECPFWAQKAICTAPTKCAICKCKENEIPETWINEKKDPVSVAHKDYFSQWETQGNRSKIEWHVEEKENDNGDYVNLIENPEAFTGYQGQNIWHAIYNENCFQGNLEDMCSEERLFYRIISGLHTSISTQLSYYYIDFEKNETYPNLPMFFNKVGDYPDRILNLYFAYSVVLRAVNRARDHIKNYAYNTGDLQNDLETKRLVDRLYDSTTKNCDYPFNETEMFNDITREQTKKQFVQYFHNISRIMDCVECEKCKVYGKLQTYGIAAALKILFAEKLEGVEKIYLKRNELIALMITLSKLSSSIEFVDKMYAKRHDRYWGQTKAVSLCAVLFIVFIWVAFKMYDDKVKKISKGIKVLEEYKNLQD